MTHCFLSILETAGRVKYGGWTMPGEVAGWLDLECADVSALWFDATCRVGESGDVSPQSKIQIVPRLGRAVHCGFFILILKIGACLSAGVFL